MISELTISKLLRNLLSVPYTMNAFIKKEFGVSANNHKLLESDKKQSDDDEETLEDSESIKRNKRNIIKNVLTISLAFFLNFIAFNSTASLQSSLNYEEGLGTGSQAIIYGAFMLSSMFVPTFVMKWLGCKWTICASIIGFVTYPLANFYPTWGTLLPSSIIVGLCSAPMWSAELTYITTSAHKYAEFTNETPEAAMARLFGIFYFIFNLSNTVGQLVSSFVLSSGDVANLVLPDCYNSSYIGTYCGAHDCQEDFNVARIEYNTTVCPVTQIQSEGVKTSLLYTLMGINTGVGLVGALVVGFFLDPITVRSNETRSPFHLLVATFKQLKDYRQICLIGISAYVGFQQAFLRGDFTRSFVSCPLAVNWVGFVLICFGGCNSLGAFLLGNVASYIGRIPLFTIGFLIYLALIIVLLVWTPYPTNSSLFFIISSLWGIADVIFHTQIIVIYADLYVSNQEAAYANYCLWLSLGFLLSFAYQSFLCVSTKLWILLGMLLVAMLLYYVVEFFEHRKLKETKVATKNHINEATNNKDENQVLLSK